MTNKYNIVYLSSFNYAKKEYKNQGKLLVEGEDTIKNYNQMLSIKKNAIIKTSAISCVYMTDADYKYFPQIYFNIEEFPDLESAELYFEVF